MPANSELSKVFGASARSLADGQGVTVDARGMASLTVIAGAGATVTVSRVDTKNADAHTEGEGNSFTVAATERETIPVDWPYYRISTAGGACRYSLI